MLLVIKKSQIAYFYAFILMVFALAQLFTFDEFLQSINSLGAHIEPIVSNLLGVLIVVSEVFALPFLIDMKLSTPVRAIGRVFGVLAPLIWLKLSLWSVLTGITVKNLGILGDKFQLAPGWWAVALSIFLLAMAIWINFETNWLPRKTHNK